MGRPRKDAGTVPADQQMVEAFWKQLKRGALAEITATSIARETQCNRATFYYYFDSVEDLARYAVESSVPIEIMDMVQQMVVSEASGFSLSSQTRHSVERLCLLAGQGGAAILLEHLKQALQLVWSERFNLDMARDDIQTIISFMAAGVIGVLGDWSNRPCDQLFDERLLTISQVFSASAINFANRTMRPAENQDATQ